jgi:hypothetical protein
MEMTFYQWVTLGLGALGFIGTWILGAFRLGRAVEQMKSGVKEQIEEEREKIIAKLEEVETRFDEEQKKQDHNFGEVGAAMRQYIANVEREMHEIEIWGRDNFVLKDDFVKATDRLEAAIATMATDIKTDLRALTTKIDAR